MSRGPRTLLLVCTALVLATAACRRAKAPPAASVPLFAEIAGCAGLRHGPRCELEKADDRKLRVWLPGPATGARTLAFDGGPPAPLVAGTPVGGGQRFEIVIPPSARLLEIVEPRPGATARFRLPIDARPGHPALAEAIRLRRSGGHNEARAALLAALPTLPPEARGPAHALLGRIANDRGEATEAVRELRTALDSALADGRLSDAVNDGLALVFVLLSLEEDLVAANAVLQRLEPLAAEHAEGRADLSYFHGLLAQRSGDLRTALQRFRDSVEQALRLGAAESALAARQELAVTLAWIGRADEAFALERALLDEAGDQEPCERAALKMNLAWIALLRHWGPGPAAATLAADARPGPLLASARQAVLESCPDPFRRRHALLNEALFALDEGDRRLARQRLADLASLDGGRTAQVTVWETELEARLALDEGKAAAAERLYARQARLARAIGFGEGAFRAEIGQGRALHAAGRSRAAIEHFQAAESMTASLLSAVPLGEGRDVFAGGRIDSARQLVSALVELGRPGDAARAARLARARVLRAAASPERLAALAPADRQRWLAAIGAYRAGRARLEAAAADDWKLSTQELEAARLARAADERRARAALDEAYRVLEMSNGTAPALQQPGPGDLFLVYFPAEEGLVGFALTAAGTRAAALGVVNQRAGPAALGSALLAPFDRELAAAARVRFLAYGPLEVVDLHALAWRGEPLIERLPVEYGLDVRVPERSRSGTAGPGLALILANPEGDLPAAEREAGEVARLVYGYEPRVLGREAATRPAALALLPQARLLHYAGHGRFGGPDGMDSSLRLAGETRLTTGDILALPSVPELVVLSACDAARPSETGTGALGVAHAFLLAGSASVLAPSRPVRDDLATEIVTVFYRERWRTSALVVGEALRAAERSARRRFPNEDWSSYRALSP